MASGHIGAYKSSNRIDPKIKRRLRRSEEWQNKRDEEVNKRRHLGLMSPCRELDVDLSMDSSTLEAHEITPHSTPNVVQNKKSTKIQHPSPKLRQSKKDQGKVETKSQQKNVKSSQASLERLKMLQKWKEEKEFKKKQNALERAKHKPFVVSINCHVADKNNFERKWEQEKQKKNTKQHLKPEAPKTRTRTVTAPVRSTAFTNSSSQRTTRQTAAALKQAAAPTRTIKAAPTKRATVSSPKSTTSTRGSTRSALAKSQPASKTGPATRAIVSNPKPAASTRAVAAPKNVPPKRTRAGPIRSSTRVSAKSDAETLPPTKIRRTTRGQKQKGDVEEIESEHETSLQEDSIVEPENETKSTFSKKSVSFAPEKFVFTAPEDLQSFEPSFSAPFTLSPTSAHNFFYTISDSIPVDAFQSSNSSQLKNVVTTRGNAVFNDKPLTCANDVEPCKNVQEDEKDSDVGECSSYKSSGTKSDSPSLDKNYEVPNETPERNVGIEDNGLIVEKNISVSKQKEPTEELCEKKCPIATTPNRVTPSPLFKTPVSQGPKTRRMRCSLSENTFDREKAAIENRRRRKTEMSRTPKTPEEWVELLKNSPMIEMSRKKISKEKLSIAPLNFEITEEDLIAANIIPSKDPSNKESTAESVPEVVSEEKDLVEPSIDSQPTTNTEDKTAEMLTDNTEDKTVENLTEIPSTILKHDVPYFRNLVKSQTDTLNSLAHEFEDLIPEGNEEVEGQIRTVIGQSKLLISKRFHQFIGLIDNCEYNTGEKEITCDDLQGFWDMVDFQVEDVRIKFEDLKKLKENGWQPLEKNPPVQKKPIKKLVKKAKPLVTAKVNKRKGRSEFALFMAQKKKEAQEMEQKVSSPKVNKIEETSLKVFDGLFFKVESPVKSPKPYCEEISASPLVIPTFVETDRTVRLSSTITTVSIAENGDKSKVDLPKIAVCPEKEAPKMEPKSPLSANACSSAVASPILSTKSLRRSFAPVVPSPLLQDITPSNRGRRNHTSFVFTDTGSPKTTVQVPEQNPKAETDEEPAEKILVLQTPPLRRSGRVRRSICSYSPNVKKTPTQELVMQNFIKNLLSSESSSEGSETSKDGQISAQSPDPASVFTPLTDGNDNENENSTLKRKSRRRRTAEPKVRTVSPKRRHSTRISRKSMNSSEAKTPSDAKENVAITIDLPPPSEDGKLKRANRKTKSVAFSDKISNLSIADSPSVLCPVSPNVDTTDNEQMELLKKSGRFQTLKVGFTPVRGSNQKQFCTPTK